MPLSAPLPLRAPRWLGALAAAALLAAAPGALRAQDVVPPDQLSQRPRLTAPGRTAQLVRASYPAALQRNGIGGTVELQFVVGTDGKVEPQSIEVLAASVPALGDAARKVVEKLEFTPAQKDAKPVRTVVALPIVYKAN